MIPTLLIGHYCNRDPSLPIPTTHFSEINLHINLPPHSRSIISFRIKILYVFLISTILSTCPGHCSFLNFIIAQILFNQQAYTSSLLPNAWRACKNARAHTHTHTQNGWNVTITQPGVDKPLLLHAGDGMDSEPVTLLVIYISVFFLIFIWLRQIDDFKHSQ
jgi:hypothetical protein